MAGGFCETVRLIVQDGREKLVGSPTTRFDSNGSSGFSQVKPPAPFGRENALTPDIIWSSPRARCFFFLAPKLSRLIHPLILWRSRNNLDILAIYFHD